MKNLFRAFAATATGVAAAGSIIAALSAPASADSTTPPPWDTFSPTDGGTYGGYSNPAGYGSVGGLLFFNAAGQQITGGSYTTAPLAAYVEGTSEDSPVGTKVELAIALPAAGDVAGWNDYSASSVATTFPITSGAPSNLEHVSTGPVYTGSSADQSLSSFFTEFSDAGNPDAGYYQVRLYTSGGGVASTEFNSADIYVDTTNDTWTLAYSHDAFTGGTASVPAPVGTSVGLTTTAGTTGVAGTSVPLTATVADADGSTPAGGTVQFFANGNAIGLPVTVSGTTAAYTYITTTADEPSDSFTAQFTPASGTNYANSTSSALPFGVTAPVGTNTVLTAAPASPVTTGTPVTFTAAVTDVDSSAPTGTVTFKDGGTVLASNVAINDVSGTYEAQYSSSSLSIATHSLSAVYNAPFGYATSTGNLSFTVTPSGDSTSTALAVNPTTVAAGAQVSVSATVTDTASGDSALVPTGTVQFDVNGIAVGSPATVNGSGVATASVTAANGTAPWNTQNGQGYANNQVTAVFTPGSGAFQTSTSGAVTVTVTTTSSSTSGNGAGNINTTLAAGALTISTPYTTANPFQLGALTLQNGGTEYKASAAFGNPGVTTSLTANDGVEVTDTGIGNQTWTASASVTDFTDGASPLTSADVINGQNLTFTGAAVGAISGNDYVAAGGSVPPGDIPISVDNVTDTLPNGFPYGSAATGSDGLSGGIHGGGTGTPVQHLIASSGAPGSGSVFIDGTLTLVAPTSVNAGTFTATLTFTAV